MDRLSVKTISLGFLSGAIALFFAAMIFNVYTGVSVYTMQTYIIPIVYGCGGGALVGYYVWKYSNLEDDIVTVSVRLSKIELLLNEKNAQLCKMTTDLENVVRGRLEVEKLFEDQTIRHKSILSNITNGVALFEPCDGGNDFVCVEMNKIGKSMTNIVGYACGKSMQKIWPESASNGILSIARNAWRTKAPQRTEVIEHDVDGKIHRATSYYLYVLDPNAEVVAIFNDITEEKLAEAKIVELEKQIADLQNRATVPIYESSLINLVYVDIDENANEYYSEFSKTGAEPVEVTSSALAFTQADN